MRAATVRRLLSRRGRPRSLTARLIATVVALVVVSSVVVGVVATLATRQYLLSRLDDDVRASLDRAATLGPPPGSTVPDDSADGGSVPDGARGGGPGDDREGDRGRGDPDFDDDLSRGSGVGTLTAFLDDGGATGRLLVQGGGQVGTRAVDTAALRALDDVRAGGPPRSVDLAGLGDYRVAARTGPDGTTVVSGLPENDVDAVVARLVAWEVGLTLAAGLAALAGGAVLVRRQLRPLREVAGTAHEVAELPLSSGEIDLEQRVPAHLTDEQTEVGRVGAALNTLLAHVESSLAARYRSEQQVRQFVADASHELRTPLATIAGYSELARRRPDDEAALRTALAKVEDESGRMTALVEDLLLLARLDSGRPLERAPVDLTRLLVEAVADAQVVAPDHRWRLDLPDEPVEVAGDERRLHQVVTNLLANARKYTPAGTEVTVRARAEGFSVHDDGPGFPPEVADRAFERFVRADPARRRHGEPGGVGLGLSLVRAVVAAHGGTVDLRTAPGDTTVDVRLPRGAPVATAPGFA